MECMACSDNTIRAGLTPKFKDVPPLVSTLTYNTHGPTYLHPREVFPGVFDYKPPVPEFSVQRITVSYPKTMQKFNILFQNVARFINNVHASSILIVIKGSAKISENIDLKFGDVIFIEASAGNVELSDASDDFMAFRAYTPQA